MKKNINNYNQTINSFKLVKSFNKKIDPSIDNYYLLESCFILDGIKSVDTKNCYFNNKSFVKVFYIGRDNKVYNKIYLRNIIREVLTPVLITNEHYNGRMKIMIKATKYINKDILLKKLRSSIFPNNIKKYLKIDKNTKNIYLSEDTQITKGDNCSFKFKINYNDIKTLSPKTERFDITTYNTFYSLDLSLKFPY